jgi:hypothetical protein
LVSWHDVLLLLTPTLQELPAVNTMKL